MPVRVKIDSPIKEEIAWIWKIFADYIDFQTEIVELEYDLLISESGSADISLSHFFRNTYLHGDREWKSYFRNELLHTTSSGKPDYLSTAFYLVNCLQEYDSEFEDEFGRFPFEVSVQHIFNCVHENIVGKYFDSLYLATPKLHAFTNNKERKTKIFLTHDIDSLYGAFGENRRYLLKHGKVGDLLRIIFNHYLATPDWMLLDRILKIENEYDVRSVFFWLVNKGRGSNRIMNADYAIGDKNVQSLINAVAINGNENGLHKSASRQNYAQELDSCKKLSPFNRNHYLRITLPQSFDQLEKNKILLDSSLGFAEDYGFRNSYGLPFRPFHIAEKRSYNFVEVPLHIMDTTFKYYLQQDPSATQKNILDFLDRNRSNCTLTVLWHNNYFFGHLYAGWLDVYKNVLIFIKENNMSSISAGELIEHW